MWRSPFALPLVAGFVVAALLVAVLPAAARAPILEISAAAEHAALVPRLAALDRDALGRAAELVGLADAGPPIPVILALEGSLAARQAPSWGVAYATSGGRIVMLPSRVPSYPHRQLETVLLHEVTHVLIDRAAGGRAVPRWFHEGLALFAARSWSLEDRSRLLWATWRGREPALSLVETRFAGDAAAAARAYSFSAAFVHWLVDRHGRDAPARILALVAADVPFSEAYRRVTGLSLVDAEARFFRHLDLWNKWVPLVTSSATLWAAITGLALVAFQRRRRRDAEIRARWEEEERRELADLPTDSWVH